MASYCAEIRPLVEHGRFLTGPDMGTSEEDFAPLRERRSGPSAMAAVVGGVPFEDVLTGYGVAVAAETALRAGLGGGWAGRSAAIEGFGKVGGGVAREVASRGGRRRRGLDDRGMHRRPSWTRRAAAARAAPRAW